MQQAIYQNIADTGNSARKSSGRTRRAGLARRIAQTWDLYGIVALMLSSGTYGVYALTHLGV